MLNVITELKKTCNHPFLFESAEEDYRGGEDDLNAVDRLVVTSGKMVLLDKLMKRLKETGHRSALYQKALHKLLQGGACCHIVIHWGIFLLTALRCYMMRSACASVGEAQQCPVIVNSCRCQLVFGLKGQRRNKRKFSLLHRVLIFSQMVRVLDIISDYMRLRGFQHQRLDGSTPSATRHQV